MKRLLTLVAFFATLQASAQQVNPVPDYVFRNQMSVGRNAVTDTGAYFSIGPRYGAVKGFMPPIVSDTASVNANKRNGLLIFSVQKNKFLYWDSVRVQWSDMAGSSGSYITGKGITGYVPQYTDTATLDTSALYTLGNQLGIGTSSFAYTGSGRTVVELNGTAGGILGFKRNDSARGYLWHTGSDMELANTVAGSISFNTNSATRGSIASDGVWRLHNLAGTGDRVVQASSNGTLSATATVTGLVDTLTISTRAWRQKGLDSLAALDVSGSGTTNYIPKFTAASTIGNSLIRDNGTSIGISTAPPTATSFVLHVPDGGIVGSSAQYTHFTSNVNYNADWKYNITSPAARYTQELGAHTFHTAASGTAGNTITWSERLRIFANGRVFVGASPTDAGYQLDVNGTLRSVNGANFATTSGNVGVGTASPAAKADITGTLRIGAASFVAPTSGAGMEFSYRTSDSTGYLTTYSRDYSGYRNQAFYALSQKFAYGTGGSIGLFLTSSGETLINTESDAGDYKLQVVGNARIGTGKLDISSNTVYGLGVARSGTSEVAGQIYNSSGILYLGAESSAGGQIFTGSSAYAAVIGSGANYPLQFATNNATRATINTNGELLINTLTDNGDFKLQVNGNGYITGNLQINPSANTTGIYMPSMSWTGSNASAAVNVSGTLNTTGAPSLIYVDVSDVASGTETNFMQFVNSDTKFRVTKQGDIQTAAPSGGTARKWKLGSVVATSVQLDTANYVEVEINGTFYRLAIVTPL